MHKEHGKGLMQQHALPAPGEAAEMLLAVTARWLAS